MTPSIIKAKAPAIEAQVIRRQVHEAKDEARVIVEEAGRRATEIEQAAEAAGTSVREHAYQEGYRAGLAQWNEILAAAFLKRDEYLGRNEQTLIRLSVRIAEKVIGEELHANPDTILHIVRESLRTVRRERNLLLLVNPKHEEQVRGRLEELRNVLGSAREIEVVGDEKVAPGGCVVESELGIIDAQISTQLDCLEQALLRGAKT